ncbi:MAG TPA: hypothetical protein VJC11_03535 [Patescibacteria group bacterium]|nr:hypothetical protein [Patescibacteria group bacterium]
MRHLKRFYYIFFLLALLTLPAVSSAVIDIGDIGLGETGNAAGFQETDVAVVVGKIIQTALSLLGIIVLIFLVYGGFLWMMSGGNEQTVKKAKDIILNAAIGLIIVLAAYAITNFIVVNIYEAV